MITLHTPAPSPDTRPALVAGAHAPSSPCCPREATCWRPAAARVKDLRLFRGGG